MASFIREHFKGSLSIALNKMSGVSGAFRERRCFTILASHFRMARYQWSPHEYWVSPGRIRTQPVEMTSDPYPTRAVPVPVVREVGRDRERARVRHRYREVDDKTCCVVQPFFARPTH